MDGIRIKGKHFQYNNSSIYYQIDYNFSEIIFPISVFLHDYYWLLLDTIFSGEIDDSILDKFILQRFEVFSDKIILCDRNFLPLFSKFLIEDNTDIYGFSKKINLWEAIDKNGNINNRILSNEVQIYFSCVDAAYWEIYARNSAILKILETIFPNFEKCTLKDKFY